MNVTREAIELRLAELQAQFDKMQVQAHAIGGAMQDCKYWLRVLDKEPEERVITEANGQQLAGGT